MAPLRRRRLRMNDDPLTTLRARFETVIQEVVDAARRGEPAPPRPADHLTDEEACPRGGRIPYWADVCVASQMLADALSTPRPGRLRVLELGCGVGLPAMVAAGRGHTVVATD